MNINQMAIGLTAGRSDGSALMVIGVSTWYPDILLSYKEEALPACKNYYMKIYHGPERTEYCIDLNVLLGKAYEKPSWPQYIRDQCVLKGPS